MTSDKDVANITPQPEPEQPDRLVRLEVANMLLNAAATMRLVNEWLQLAAVTANRAPDGLEVALDIGLVLAEQHQLTLKVQNGADALQRQRR